LRVEAVEFETSGHVDDTGFAGLAGGKVAGLLGLAGAAAVGAIPDVAGGGEDLQQEGGQGQVKPVRGETPP
jgi:hypothetical protein